MAETGDGAWPRRSARCGTRLVGFGEISEVLKLLGYLLLEHDDVAAILDDRAHRLVLKTIDFIDLLAVAGEKAV